MSKSATSSPSKGRIVQVRSAGPDHQVVSIESGTESRSWRKEPCAECPWRIDATGVFPAEAFMHSARTAYDMSTHVFACHDSGSRKPAVCAGFALKGGAHNLSMRLAAIQGTLKRDISDGGHQLHDSYRAMAIANGVDPDDPILAPCRD